MRFLMVFQERGGWGEADYTRVCVRSNVGPAGVRALAAAMLGQHAEMKGGPYKKFKSLNLWSAGAGLTARRPLQRCYVLEERTLCFSLYDFWTVE